MIYLDRVAEREFYGIFPDQRFYSVEYRGELPDEVAAFAAQVTEFEAFCKEAYRAVNANGEMPSPPSFIKKSRAKTQTKSSTEEG